MSTPISNYNPRPGKPRLWAALGRRISPITLKIVSFNLVALSLLVTGTLILNRTGDGQISQRQAALLSDAQVLATAISQQVSDSGILTITLAKQLGILAAPIGAQAQLFTIDGVPVLGISGASDPNKTTLDAAGDTNSFTEILGEAWGRIAAVFSETAPQHNSDFLDPARATIARDAVNNSRTTNHMLQNDIRQQIITVASPIFHNKVVVGAVVLSTLPGEIDGYVLAEQRRILEIFTLAMVTSIFLSIILARTIAHPLRQLTEAAERGSLQDATAFSIGRINIPDLSARPDEIGDLSRQMGNMTTALYDRIDENAAFAADVAHEIKNPLTSLGSAVETLRYAKSEMDRDALLNVIRDDVRRMDRLVTDISNASRLDAELVHDELELFDITYLLNNLVDYQKGLAAKQKVILTSKMPRESIEILGLQSRLAQVFVNLITNAVSFVPEGGHVKVIVRTEGKAVRICIEDTGCGIPEENLNDVFKRFYSSRPEQEFGNNSGLGLAISKQIVEAHGGKIWAENIYASDIKIPPPSGARFTVILPL